MAKRTSQGTIRAKKEAGVTSSSRPPSAPPTRLIRQQSAKGQRIGASARVCALPAPSTSWPGNMRDRRRNVGGARVHSGQNESRQGHERPATRERILNPGPEPGREQDGKRAHHVRRDRCVLPCLFTRRRGRGLARSDADSTNCGACREAFGTGSSEVELAMGAAIAGLGHQPRHRNRGGLDRRDASATESRAARMPRPASVQVPEPFRHPAGFCRSPLRTDIFPVRKPAPKRVVGDDGDVLQRGTAAAARSRKLSRSAKLYCGCRVS